MSPMKPSRTSALETEVSELKILVNNLLDKVNRLTTENTALREEVRHQKKLKGQPKIRPGKKPLKNDKDSKPTSGTDNTAQPKSKRPRTQEPGRTAKPSPSSTQDKICKAEGVQDNWKNKGYRDFTQIDVNLEFTTTRYRREVWLLQCHSTSFAGLVAQSRLAYL